MVYHLTFQFKSNERPWSGSHEARGIETDEAAIKWAGYFMDKIGDDYQITLYKNGAVLPIPQNDSNASTAPGMQRGNLPEPIKATPLAAALGVNGLTICDCGYDSFRIGLAYNPSTGNNFIRILECTDCGRQLAATHNSDNGLAPSVGKLNHG